MVLLAGPGDTTDIVANYLAARVADLEVIVEHPPSRTRMARRRAQRVGWPEVAGQVLFVAAGLPLLRRCGRGRIGQIISGSGLDTTPYRGTHTVGSVNDAPTVELLRSMAPAAVVVQGTRIISPTVLAAVGCPFINVHAGITPRYRGVHGGYWALAEGRPDMVGTTVHLVDQGIDTGAVLARARFDPTPRDTIATYPYLHLAAGLPLLADQVDRVLAGQAPTPADDGAVEGGSRLYLHPTVWGYLVRRLRRGVR